MLGMEQSVQEIIITMGYLGIVLVMFLECVFPPIPSEVVLPFAGFLVATGELQFASVLLASVIGSLAGALVLYAVGMWSSESVILQFLRRYGRYLRITETHYQNVLRHFNCHGKKIIFFGRLVPVIRSLISLPAGANHMPLTSFISLTVLGLLIWNTTLIGLGNALGHNWESVTRFTAQYQMVTVGALLLVSLGFVGFKLADLSRQKTSDKPAL